MKTILFIFLAVFALESNVNDQVLTGGKTLIVVDRNFITSKEFKKYSETTKMNCLQTGKAGAGCVKDGITANTRIYHVTI